jgi:hypothetical protein
VEGIVRLCRADFKTRHHRELAPDELHHLGDQDVDKDQRLSFNEKNIAEVFASQAGRYPGFAGYQAKTARTIPVIALTLQR